MRSNHSPARALIVGTLILLQVASPAIAGEPVERLWKLFPFSHNDVGRPPHTGKDTCVEHLAKNIDWLENQINVYGTVVAKTPDVWGEARLTAHRQEFEEQLKAQLRAFDPNRINGAEFVSDQAFLNFAYAMNSKQDGATGVPPAITLNSLQSGVGVTPPEGSTSPTTITSTLADSKSFFGFDPTQLKFGPGGIQLEQTEVLDQLARYVMHLHELRRINEGDDTSDAPGYSMNLVRIPISVLPGQRTKYGYGAEITVTAEPYLGPELLPTAFRDLVVNDLVDQLSIPLTRFLNAAPADLEQLREQFAAYENFRKEMAKYNRGSRQFLSQIERKRLSTKGYKGGCFFSDTGDFNGIALTDANIPQFFRELDEVIALASPQNWAEVSESIARNPTRHRYALAALADVTQPQTAAVLNRPIIDANLLAQRISADPKIRAVPDVLDYVTEQSREDLIRETGLVPLSTYDPRNDKEARSLLTNQLQIASIAASSTRRSTLPFPPSQLVDNYGFTELGHLVHHAHDVFRADILNRGLVHITDVNGYLREEIGAAYELLANPGMEGWWTAAVTHPGTIPSLVRLRGKEKLEAIRTSFMNSVQEVLAQQASERAVVGRDMSAHDPVHYLAIDAYQSQSNTAANCAGKDLTATAALAWCVYVESLLLNERLLADMRETFGNVPNSPAMPQWMAFFGPTPCEEARQLFAQYVKVRWPLKVFALDPVVTEQNVADIRSLYRQMQMSIAFSFAQGNIGRSAAMQAMRRLQRDRATLDLNRTAVGFGHGDDTFGWRFYPRFQNLPVEGNATVFLRDMIVGGPTDKQLERKREIEPGMRECIAVVLMPSFVPHVTFTTRGNWFKLGCEGHTASSIHDTVHFSRAVKSMQMAATECMQCSNLYRDGEVDRLLTRVHQLDRKLPLQTLECQVPIENTHGGFEIFSSGTRELAPELTGWYGAPGYDPDRNCQLFLSGDSFNVTSTRLIVGNREVPFELLSRQILSVTLPAGLPVIRDKKLNELPTEFYDGYLDAHLATPYGVSGHLLIPVLRSSPQITRVTLTANVIDFVVDVTKDAQDQITDVSVVKEPKPLTLPAFIQVPGGVGLGGTAPTLIVQPIVGADRLGEVRIPLTPSLSGKGYEVTAETTINQFAPGEGTFAQSLKDYIEYLVKVRNERPGLLRIDSAVFYQDADKSATLPVNGSFNVKVNLRYKIAP
jgi:hypothetical protein